jgi:SAM-dependent methyltransferase
VDALNFTANSLDLGASVEHAVFRQGAVNRITVTEGDTARSASTKDRPAVTVLHRVVRTLPAAEPPGPPAAPAPARTVLHVGCGPRSPRRLHPLFRGEDWAETRLDVDPAVAPDIVCSITDMRGRVADHSVDAIWSSHNVEHLDTHEVGTALREFVRVLSPAGFALIRCPDLRAVAEFIVANGPEAVAYESPAGPITPLDMLFGHNASIRAGQTYMRHATAFTQERLGRVLLEAGFDEVRTARVHFDLWAVAFMPIADAARVLDELRAAGLDLRVDA